MTHPSTHAACSMMSFIQKAFCTVSDFIMPRRCFHCGADAPTELRYICWDCMTKMQFVQPAYCQICGRMVAGVVGEDYVCLECLKERPAFDQARACFIYEDPIRELIHNIKYNNHIWLVPDLARLMARAASIYFDATKIEGIAFVPLYPTKYRERGFNQSELLARQLASTMHIPLLNNCLRRTEMTVSQTRLTRSMRKRNVAHVFISDWKSWLDGKRVLLVDDVMTTGATLNACAKALKDKGAASVYGLTAARGL